MEDFEKTYPTKNVKLLYKQDTIFSSDSVEWCPHEPHRNYFVCANYQLAEDESEGKSEKPRERSGRILLFSINIENGLHLEQTIETAAVLDQKWSPCLVHDKVLLAVVNAKGTLEIYEFSDGKLSLLMHHTIESDETETLLLSLDWSTGKFESNVPQIVCSNSKGNADLFSLNSEGLVHENSWHCHEYEAWIAAFYYWDANIMFTGGDDSCLLKFDKRVGWDPVSKNRSHDAGVTCAHSNASKEFVLATGSYDANLRIWDIRNMTSPTSTLQMPGPLWRLKWDPFGNTHLLAACMLGGAHVVNAKNANNPKIVDSFYEHKNIVYGADWCHSKEQENNRMYTRDVLIGTCSFYDHLLCVSKIKLDD